MAAADRGPVIRLQGGPCDKWHRAAQRMHRSTGDPAGWPLLYERPMSGLIWVCREGKDCHPNPID
jgi:hypothetical protein